MKRRNLLCAALSALPAAWAGTSTLESLRWLPEDRIDVGRASFALSQEFYPSVDIESFSRQLDAMAAAVRRKVKSPNDPEERVWAMNTVFFQERGIRYDHDPQGRQKPLNYLLHGLLETGKGMCFSMPLLYVAVGQRLGYPIALVCVPDHTFARYVDPAFPNGNIEATSGGKRFTDDDYIGRHGVNATALKSGAYMRPLTMREHLGVLITCSAYIHALRKDVATCLQYLKASLTLAPRLAAPKRTSRSPKRIRTTASSRPAPSLLRTLCKRRPRCARQSISATCGSKTFNRAKASKGWWADEAVQSAGGAGKPAAFVAGRGDVLRRRKRPQFEWVQGIPAA